MRELEPVLLVDLFPLERQALLQLLAQLSEEEWQYDTICPGWSVKDIVLHQQQIRDAVGRPGFKEPPVFAPVLETFVRALPYTFREVHASEGTCIHLLITGEAGGEWFLQREQAKWVMGKSSTQQPEATITFDQETAWQLFTKGMSKEDALQKASLSGNEQLAMKVLDTVSIIA